MFRFVAGVLVVCYLIGQGKDAAANQPREYKVSCNAAGKLVKVEPDSQAAREFGEQECKHRPSGAVGLGDLLDWYRIITDAPVPQ